jgi:hypothetical protein
MHGRETDWSEIVAPQARGVLTECVERDRAFG